MLQSSVSLITESTAISIYFRKSLFTVSADFTANAGMTVGAPRPVVNRISCAPAAAHPVKFSKP